MQAAVLTLESIVNFLIEDFKKLNLGKEIETKAIYEFRELALFSPQILFNTFIETLEDNKINTDLIEFIFIAHKVKINGIEKIHNCKLSIEQNKLNIILN